MELNTQIYGQGVNIPTYGANDFKCSSNGDGTLARTIKELHTNGKIVLNQHIDPSISYCYSYGSKLCSYAYVMPTIREAPPTVQRHENPFANYFFMSDYGFSSDAEYTYYMSPQYANRIGYGMPESTTLNGFSRWLYTRYALARIRFCCYVDYYTVNRTGAANVAVYVGGGQITLKEFMEDATLQQKYNNNELVVWRLTWRAYIKDTPDAIQGSFNQHFKIGSLVDMNKPVNDEYLTSDVYMFDSQLEIIQGGQTGASQPSALYNYNYLFTNTSNRWNFETLGYSGTSNVRVIATLPPEKLMDAFHEFAYTGLFYTNNTTTAANSTLADADLYWGIIAFGRTSGKYKQGNPNWSDDEARSALGETNPPLLNDTDPETDPNPDYTGQNDPSQVDPNDYALDTPLTPPAISTIDVFNRSFAMNITQMRALADWLWNADDDRMGEIIDGLKLMGENPMNALIDCRLYPFAITDMIETTGGQLIKIGRVTSDVYGIKLGNSSNCIIDLGECSFYEENKNFLDYTPYTQARLYLPYCGWHSIDPAEFMGKKITGKLIVDVVTGACNCIIYANGIILINATGTIGVEIPMTGTDSAAFASQTINASMQCISNIVQAGAGVIGGMGNISKGTGLTMRATNIGSLNSSREADYRLGSSMQAEGAQQFSTGLGSAADAVYAGWKAHTVPVQYEMAGAATPACANWLPQYAYFVIDRPVPLIPDNYGHAIGFACCKSGLLSGFSGFTVCSNVDTSGFAQATEAERAELKALLEAGVYL